jgi:hypothetical protein
MTKLFWERVVVTANLITTQKLYWSCLISWEKESAFTRTSAGRRRVVSLNKYTQCITPPRVVETANGKEKSSSAKHGTNQVLGNGIYVCTRMYQNAIFQGCWVEHPCKGVLSSTNVRSGPQNPESCLRILCQLDWHWQYICPPAS